MADEPLRDPLGRFTRIVFSPTGLATALKSPEGPVGREVIIRGERVKQAAIRLAPRKSGNLAAHIVKRITTRNGQIQVLVGVENVDYAIWVHEGAQPHTITGNPLLVFFWAQAGGIVFFRSVNHPGNSPNRFLIRAAEREGQLATGSITQGEFLQLTS